MNLKKNKSRSNAFNISAVKEKYNLSETDKSVLTYKLRFPDITNKELSLLVGVTSASITFILKKPAFKLALKDFEGDWREKLINAKEKAANQLIKLITNPNPAISIRACENILGKWNMGEDEFTNFEIMKVKEILKTQMNENL